jgi:hypothetical protein
VIRRRQAWGQDDDRGEKVLNFCQALGGIRPKVCPAIEFAEGGLRQIQRAAAQQVLPDGSVPRK